MQKGNKRVYPSRHLQLEIPRIVLHDSSYMHTTHRVTYKQCKNLFLSSLLLRTSSLLLIRTTELLAPILSLLPLLSRGLLNLRGNTNTDFSVMGLDTHWSDWVPRVNTGRREGTWGKSCLEFFEIRFRVIDQREPS